MIYFYYAFLLGFLIKQTTKTQGINGDEFSPVCTGTVRSDLCTEAEVETLELPLLTIYSRSPIDCARRCVSNQQCYVYGFSKVVHKCIMITETNCTILQQAFQGCFNLYKKVIINVSKLAKYTCTSTL